MRAVESRFEGKNIDGRDGNKCRFEVVGVKPNEGCGVQVAGIMKAKKSG